MRPPGPICEAGQVHESTTDLVKLLTLEREDEVTFVDPFMFRGTPAEHQRTFGGQVLAQALMAASRTVDDSRRCHSLHAYFLRPASNAAPIRYRVELTRDGRSFSQRRVKAIQGDRLLFTLISSFQITEPGWEHSDPQPASTGDPESLQSLADVLTGRLGEKARTLIEWRGLDVRYDGDAEHELHSSAHSTGLRVWAKVRQQIPDDPRIHQALAAYLTDMTILNTAAVAHGTSVLAPDVTAASIDHAMWFHRPLRIDRWLMHDQISPSASNLSLIHI